MVQQCVFWPCEGSTADHALAYVVVWRLLTWLLNPLGMCIYFVLQHYIVVIIGKKEPSERRSPSPLLFGRLGSLNLKEGVKERSAERRKIAKVDSLNPICLLFLQLLPQRKVLGYATVVGAIEHAGLSFLTKRNLYYTPHMYFMGFFSVDNQSNSPV